MNSKELPEGYIFGVDFSNGKDLSRLSIMSPDNRVTVYVPESEVQEARNDEKKRIAQHIKDLVGGSYDNPNLVADLEEYFGINMTQSPELLEGQTV